MLAADTDVAMDVAIPVDCCLPCPEVMVECMPWGWMEALPIEDMNVVLPIDETGVMVEPEFTDVMFYSMGSMDFEEGEAIPFDETVVIEEVVDFMMDGSLDPMIYASFPPLDDGEVQQPVDEPFIAWTLGWPSETDDLAAIPETDGGFEIPAEALFSSASSDDDSTPEPAPAVVVEPTPRARVFAAFGQPQGSFTNLFFTAMGTSGANGNGSTNDDVIGGRRRARR